MTEGTKLSAVFIAFLHFPFLFLHFCYSFLENIERPGLNLLACE